MDTKALGTEPILTLDDVYAGYGKMTILHGTSFAVPRDAVTTVIGPNGTPTLSPAVLDLRVDKSWAVVHGAARGALKPACGGAAVAVDDRFVMILSKDARNGWKVARLLWRRGASAAGSGPRSGMARQCHGRSSRIPVARAR